VTRPRASIVDALSIDVEGFLESNAESFGRAVPAGHGPAERREIERNMGAVFELLDGLGVRATMFFLDTVAVSLPNLVREAAELGHEVACHGDCHERLSHRRGDDLPAGLRRAKDRLEDLAGGAVLGFRAPEFSITRSNLWALDVLRDLGFAYDSSIYPIGVHDVYGIAGAPRFPHALSNGLIEFPLSTVEVLGRRVPVAGGGYLRFAPQALTERAVRRIHREGHPANVFLHPYELGPAAPRVGGLSRARRLRHYHGLRTGPGKLRAMAGRFRLGPVRTSLEAAGHRLDAGRENASPAERRNRTSASSPLAGDVTTRA